VRKMTKILLIAMMCGFAGLGVVIMKKVAPEDKAYPIWALLIVFLFSLVVITH
jgi:hypothetical protein